MKGKVTAQRLLLNEFEKWDKRLAATRVRHEQLMTRWVLDNPNFRGRDADNIPREVQIEIQQLEEVLHYYHPDRYPRPDWLAGDENE